MISIGFNLYKENIGNKADNIVVPTIIDKSFVSNKAELSIIDKLYICKSNTNAKEETKSLSDKYITNGEIIEDKMHIYTPDIKTLVIIIFPISLVLNPRADIIPTS